MSPPLRRVCETRIPEEDHHIHYVEPSMKDKTNCGDVVEFECEECYESPQLMHHECQPSKQVGDQNPILQT